MFLTKSERRVVLICLLIIALLLALVFIGQKEAERQQLVNEYPCAYGGIDCPTLEPEAWPIVIVTPTLPHDE